MSRVLSLTARQAANAQETSQVFLLKLTIEHADLAEPIRVICDHVDHTIGGQVYTGFPFRAAIPPEPEDRPPRCRLEIDNVDRQIVAAIRTIQGSPTITLEVVLSSTPTVVEAGPFILQLQNAEYDALTVSGDLGYESILDLPSPKGRYTPPQYPGLF